MHLYLLSITWGILAQSPEPGPCVKKKKKKKTGGADDNPRQKEIWNMALRSEALKKDCQRFFNASLLKLAHWGDEEAYVVSKWSNPVEVLTFSGFCSQLLKLRSKLRWSWLTWFQIRSSIYETFHISLQILR